MVERRSWESGCEARLIRVLAPAQNVVIGGLNRAGDFGPEILALNALSFSGCGQPAKFGILDQQAEHALQICPVAAPEGEASAFDHFIVFWNIAGQYAHSRRHGIE